MASIFTPKVSSIVDLGCGTTPVEAGLQGGTIQISAGEIDKMLENYPASPKTSCIIKKNSKFSIPRVTKMSLGLSLKICTDGTIDIM